MTAGKLRSRAAFQARVMIDDGYGNTVGAWQDRFARWCNVKLLRGSETVMAARLQARQPAILTVRKEPDTEQIDASWRAVIDGRTYAIREDPRPSDDRLKLEFLCESGVAS